MSVNYEVLIESKTVETALTLQYTSGAKTIIDTFVARNNDAASGTLKIYLVPNGGAADISNLFAQKVLASGDEYVFPTIVGRAMNAGGEIWTSCTGVAVAIGAAGRRIS